MLNPGTATPAAPAAPAATGMGAEAEPVLATAHFICPQHPELLFDQPGACAACGAALGLSLAPSDEAGFFKPAQPRTRLIWPLPLSAFVVALALLDPRVSAFIVALPNGAGVLITLSVVALLGLALALRRVSLRSAQGNSAGRPAGGAPYRASVVWTGFTGSKTGVTASGCGSLDEAHHKALAAALSLGWTPPRWWQWWRRADTQPVGRDPDPGQSQAQSQAPAQAQAQTQAQTQERKPTNPSSRSGDANMR